jgi:predicted NBD/HSP70 family sugar kinase
VIPRSIGGVPDVRRHNLSVLLQLLHLGGAMRRAELTDLTGLNRSTVAGLVAELETLDAVCLEPGQPRLAGPGPDADPGRARKDAGKESGNSQGKRSGKAGRPSPVVRPKPESVQVLAADVAVGRVSMALVGIGGSVVARRSRQFADDSPQTIARLLSGLGRELLSSPKVGRHVVGLGVSVPGVVRGADGNVRFAPNLGWQDAPLGELLRVALDARGICALPVQIGNDGDLGALAEHQRGVARGFDDVVFVEGEVGVGCGVITGGRPLSGAGGYAGELGHITIRRGGRRCRCGARGCWETEIGAEAMARALGLPDGASEDQVVELLRAGGPREAEKLDGVAHYLGLGLANVVNLLNPQVVVLGGLLRDFYPLVQARVISVLSGAALRAPMEQVRLALPELGGDAVLIGAAEFAWRATLDDPVAVLG